LTGCGTFNGWILSRRLLPLLFHGVQKTQKSLAKAALAAASPQAGGSAIDGLPFFFCARSRQSYRSDDDNVQNLSDQRFHRHKLHSGR
jgi:hypothetical protein